MTQFLFILAPIAMIVVAIILAIGLFNMMRGGDPHKSQKMMRYRIIAQAVALVIMMAALYMASR